jgi:hypothetical protein
MWTTPTSVSKPLVQYGLSASSLTYSASATTGGYTVGSYKSGSIHTAILTGLKDDTTYYYRAGDASGNWWTSVASFSTAREYPVRFIATGDIGTAPECLGCPLTIKEMLKAHSEETIDFVLHSGDIAYADGNQTMWDDWQQQMQPITKNIPYMFSVGNHEVYDGFIAFEKRFTMPSTATDPSGGNFYYSYNYGPVHIIVLDSESTSFKHHHAQYQWLEADLAAVDRQQTPWVFTSWHRPWYSSKKKADPQAEDMRSHFEDLLHQYNIPIYFNGHNHNYERLVAMYNGQTDPTGAVTLIVGNGGTKEISEKAWIEPEPSYSVTRIAEYGIGVATLHNDTHMHWQMRLQTGQVYDDWWFVRSASPRK